MVFLSQVYAENLDRRAERIPRRREVGRPPALSLPSCLVVQNPLTDFFSSLLVLLESSKTHLLNQPSSLNSLLPSKGSSFSKKKKSPTRPGPSVQRKPSLLPVRLQPPAEAPPWDSHPPESNCIITTVNPTPVALPLRSPLAKRLSLLSPSNPPPIRTRSPRLDPADPLEPRTPSPSTLRSSLFLRTLAFERPSSLSPSSPLTSTRRARQQPTWLGPTLSLPSARSSERREGTQVPTGREGSLVSFLFGWVRVLTRFRLLKLTSFLSLDCFRSSHVLPSDDDDGGW